MANEIMLGDLNLATADPRIAVAPVDNTTANLISAIGSIGGDVIQGVQTGRTKRAIEEETETFQTTRDLVSRGVTYDPERDTLRRSVTSGDASLTYDIGSVGEEEEALLEAARAAYGRSAEVFKQYMSYTDQKGGDYMASRHARTRMEGELKRIINQTPGFEDAIRQAATDVLGYSPTGWAVRQILDVDKPGPDTKEPRTEFQKRVDLYHEAVNAQGIPMTWEEAARIIGTQVREEEDNKLYSAQIEGGEYTTQFVLDKYRKDGAEDLWRKVAVTMAEAKAANDGKMLLDTEANRLIGNSILSWKNETRARIQNTLDTNPRIIRTAAIDEEIETLLNNSTAAIEAIQSNSSLTEYMTRRAEQFGAQSTWAMIQENPGISAITYGIPHADVAKDIIDILYGSGSTEAERKVWGQNWPILARLMKQSPGLDPQDYFGALGRRLLGETIPTAELDRLGITEGQLKQGEVAVGVSLLGAANSKEARRKVVETLGNSSPALPVAVIAGNMGPSTFDSLDDSTRAQVKAQQTTDVVRELGTLSETLFTPGRFNTPGNIRIDVDPASGRISVKERKNISSSAFSKGSSAGDRWGDMRLTSEQQKIVNSYNGVHLKFYSDPKFREYLLGKGIESPAQATQYMILSSQEPVLREREREAANKVREEKDFLSLEIGRAAERDASPEEIARIREGRQQFISGAEASHRRVADELHALQQGILEVTKGRTQ